jgi:hypothetical protein
MTVSFYMNTQTDREKPFASTIKFGSYDEDSIAKDSEFTFLRTVDATSWDISAEHINYGTSPIKLTSAKVRFEPGLPYLYLPHSAFHSLTYWIHKRHP